MILTISTLGYSQYVKVRRFHPKLIQKKSNIDAEAVGEGTSLTLLSNLTLDLVEASLSLADLITEAKLDLSSPLIEALENLTEPALETKKVLIEKLVSIPGDLADEVQQLKITLTNHSADVLQSLVSNIARENLAAAEFLLTKSLELVNKSVELGNDLLQFKESLAVSALDYGQGIINYKLERLAAVKNWVQELALSSEDLVGEVYEAKLEMLESLSDLTNQVYNATLFYGQEFYRARVQVTGYIADLVRDVVHTKLDIVRAIAKGGMEAGEVIGAGVRHVIEAKIEAIADIYDRFSRRLGAAWCRLFHCSSSVY